MEKRRGGNFCFFSFHKEIGKGLSAEFCRALIPFSRKPNNLITTTAETDDVSDNNDDDNDTNYGKDKDDVYKRSGAY